MQHTAHLQRMKRIAQLVRHEVQDCSLRAGDGSCSVLGGGVGAVSIHKHHEPPDAHCADDGYDDADDDDDDPATRARRRADTTPRNNPHRNSNTPRNADVTAHEAGVASVQPRHEQPRCHVHPPRAGRVLRLEGVRADDYYPPARAAERRGDVFVEHKVRVRFVGEAGALKQGLCQRMRFDRGLSRTDTARSALHPARCTHHCFVSHCVDAHVEVMRDGPKQEGNQGRGLRTCHTPTAP
jgi:hypothetical protein